MVNSIRNLNLHDSELIEIVIKMDEVTMLLDYIEDYETMKCSRKHLIFRGCTEMSLKINGGYASPDSILDGDEFPSDRGRKVRIETNTTASVIEITASEIELI